MTINTIKTYSFLILSLLLVLGQLAVGQDAKPPIITSVTVKPLPNNPGAVEIYWTDARDSYGYIIFKYLERTDTNNLGFHPIDTLLSPINLTYIDLLGVGNKKSEAYRIESFTDIMNGQIVNGSISEPSATIFLNPIDYNACAKTNSLIWNRYLGQEITYNIYANGVDISNLDQEQNNNDTLFIHNVSENQDIQYEIRAFTKSPIDPNQILKISTSNTASIFTSPIKPINPNNFYINKITYNGSTAIFTAVIDTTADLSGHSLMLSSDNNIFTEVDFDSINKSSNTLEFPNTISGQPQFYKINAIGICNDIVLSTKVVKPIVLSISESNETAVTLNWNQSYIQSDESYSLNVQIDGVVSSDAPVTLPLTLNYEDLDAENKGEHFCFTVTATETLGNISISNSVCASRVPNILIPNAFTPNGDGTNDRFGPFETYIKNVDLAEFKITIYDKYGGAIYVADEATSFWTGLSNRASLKYVPEGGYIYFLSFKTAQGKTYEKSGTINVVYP